MFVHVYSHVVLQPEVLDVLAEALEGVLADGLDLVVVGVEGLEAVDAAQGRAGEGLDLVAGQGQRLQAPF